MAASAVIGIAQSQGLLDVRDRIADWMPSRPFSKQLKSKGAAKARPGVLNFASVGPGRLVHLTFELLKKRTGIDVVHVPFKGTNESLPALFAGDIQTTFDTLPSLLPHIQAGRLRALAVTTLQRVPQLPRCAVAEGTVAGRFRVRLVVRADRTGRHAAADRRPAL